MEFVAMLRVLRRHRALVALGLLVATAVGIASLYRPSLRPLALHRPQQVLSTATARVLIAGRNAPTFDLYPKVAGTLGLRSLLLANLMGTTSSTGAIARRAGLRPGDVGVVVPAASEPPVEVPLAVEATAAAAADGATYVLTVAANGGIPIITMTAAGPDPVGAAKVVDAATATLRGVIARKHAESVLVAERLGPTFTRTSVKERSPAAAVAVAMLLFATWCAAVVVLTSLRRSTRVRGAAPQLPLA